MPSIKQNEVLAFEMGVTRMALLAQKIIREVLGDGEQAEAIAKAFDAKVSKGSDKIMDSNPFDWTP